MQTKVNINQKYVALFVLLLLIEIFIALYVHDQIVRPFVGDILIIILLYNFMRIFWKDTPKMLPIYLFALGAVVELMQYFRIVERLNLQNNRILAVMIGMTFDVKDIGCYFMGAIILLAWQSLECKAYSKKHNKKSL